MSKSCSETKGEAEAAEGALVVVIKQEQEFHIECSDNELMDDEIDEQEEFNDIYEIYELGTDRDANSEYSSIDYEEEYGESSVDTNNLGSSSSSENGDEEEGYSDAELTDEENYTDEEYKPLHATDQANARVKPRVQPKKLKDDKHVRAQRPPRRTEEELKQMMSKIEQVAELYRNPAKLADPVVPVFDKKSAAPKRHYTDKFLKEKYMMWKCPVCDIELPTKHLWRTHLDEAHQLLNRDALHMEYVSARKARCLQCHKEMQTTFRKLLQHEISHMPNSNYVKCTLCEYRASNESTMEYHLRQMHSSDISKSDLTDSAEDVETRLNSELTVCPYCQRSFDVLPHMLIHIREKHKRINTTKCLYICPDCGLEYIKCTEFHQHLIDAHGYGSKEKTRFVEREVADNCGVKRSFQCLECAEICRIEVEMREHAVMHSGLKCFKCVYCQSCFDTHRELRIHFCAELREEYLTCDLNRARRRRPDNVVYLCPMCGLEFSWKGRRSQHEKSAHNMGEPAGLNFVKVEPTEKMHSVNALYKCTVCARKMKLNMELMWRHAVVHMPYGCWKCKECEQSFRNPQIIYTHLCTDSTKRASVYVRKPNILREYHKSRMIRRFCPICNQEFENAREFWMHIQHNHDFTTLADMHMEAVDDKYLKCWDCNVLIQNNNAVKREHRFLHLPYKPYKCKRCEDQFSTLYEVCDHLSSCNKQDANTTSGSSKNERTAAAPTNSVNSVAIHATEKFAKIICTLCVGTDFPSRLALASHFRKEHNSFQEEYICNPNGSMNCKHCNRFFNDCDRKRMLRHQKCHLENCFLCRQCEYTAQDIRELYEHIKKAHPTILDNFGDSENLIDKTATADPLEAAASEVAKTTKIRMAINTERAQVYNEYCEHISYACPECNEPLPTQSDWHAHINNQHTFFDEDKMNIELASNGGKCCKDCGITINGGILHTQRHKLTHMPYKSFICTLCTHRSNTINVLIGHIRRRHFTRGEYKCEVCEQVLDTSFARYEHIKTHDTKDWPENLCRVCYQVLSSKHSLINHMTTHDPDRKLVQCKYCDCQYTNPKELERHMNACHWDNVDTTEENPSSQSSCAVCAKDFKSAEALSVHLQTHAATEIPATVCQICGRKFKTARSCATHRRLHKSIRNVGHASEVKEVEQSKRKTDVKHESTLKSTMKKEFKKKRYDYEGARADNLNDAEMIVPDDYI